MQDYDRRAATTNYGKEGTRLRALADELNGIEERLRQIADEAPFATEYAKRLPREFRGIYDAKKAQRELEHAAVTARPSESSVAGPPSSNPMTTPASKLFPMHDLSE